MVRRLLILVTQSVALMVLTMHLNDDVLGAMLGNLELVLCCSCLPGANSAIPFVDPEMIPVCLRLLILRLFMVNVRRWVALNGNLCVLKAL